MKLDIHAVAGVDSSCIQSIEISPEQVTVGGLREFQRYTFTVSTNVPLLAYVDDVLLESLPGAAWLWDSGFCIGTARLDFVNHNGVCIGSAALQISSDDSKLSSDELGKLLDELLELAPEKIFGDSQTSLSLGPRGQIFGNVLYERMRKYGPLFCRALRSCQQRPHTSFETRARLASIEKVRRLSRQNLLDPRVVAYGRLTDHAIEGRSPPVIRTERPERNFDTLPNRSLRTMTKKVLRIAEMLRAQTNLAGQNRNDVGFARSMRRGQTLERIAAELKSALVWFSDKGVKPDQDASHGLAQMLRMPSYAHAVRLSGLACSPTFDAGGAAQAELPLNSSWGLYEEWCFERTRLVIESILGATAHHASNLFGGGAHAYTFKTPDQTITFAAQVTFGSGAEPKQSIERYSLSRERRPDSILSITQRDKTQWYIFDAKYRQSKPNVLDAMASAHIYRDSLLLNGKRCDGAILLSPGSAFDDRWKVFSPDHWSEFGTGVMSDFRPDGQGLTTMTQLLEMILKAEQ